MLLQFMMVLANLEFFLLFVSTAYFNSQGTWRLLLPAALLALTKEDHTPEGKEKLN